MGRREKRILSLILAIVVITIPVYVSAEPEEEHVHNRELKEILINNEEEHDFCGKFYCDECEQEYYDTITTADIGMPIINIDGSLDGISKNTKVEVNMDYSSESLSFTSICTLKVQGSTSSGFPKKNYTVQFLKDTGKKNKIKIVNDWGKQSKYCLKANYVDFSQSRNVVSGKLFNQIVKSREMEDEIGSLPNGGVVDGYPVVVYLNGEFLGLYTMNIPKDNWMFGMDDESKKQAILMGDNWTASVALNTKISDINNVEASGWAIEYCSTEDDPELGVSWIGSSMNDFMDFLMNNNGEDLKLGINEYTDVNRAIDVLIYTYFIHANDNLAKNILWATYDGKKWIPSVYDMDGSWGMVWNGSFDYSATDLMPGNGNLLFKRLLENYPDEIRERYFELRDSVLSKANIENEFKAFFNQITTLAYQADGKKWPGIPSQNTNNFNQIENFYSARLVSYDEWFEKLHAHEWDDGEVSEEPSCTEKGTKLFTCTVEGCEATRTEEIATIDHEWSDDPTIDKAATCTGVGSQSIHCKNCAATKDTEEIPAKDHDWNEGEVTKSPSCTEKGEKKYTCTRDGCGATKTKELAVKDHDWDDGEVTKRPSCTEKGEKTFTCTRDGCGATRKEVIVENGHDWKKAFTIDKAPSCTKAGSQSIHCNNCVAIKDTEEIPALHHDWNEGEISKQATCTEKGERKYTCTRAGCGAIKTDEFPATGHHIVRISAVKASCCEYGYKAHYECEDCHLCFADNTGTVIVSKDDYKIKKEKHVYTKNKATKEYLKRAATCKKKAVYYKSCKFCGKKGKETFKRGKKLGHKYVKYVTAKGKIKRKCKRCGHIKTK